MARRKQTTLTADGGPYVSAAVLCEKVLQEKDGVNSIVRIIDRVILTAGGEAPPEELPPIPLNVTIYLSLRSGLLRGKYTLTIQPIAPSHERKPEARLSVLFEGDERGVNLIMPMSLTLHEEGLYWFEVRVDQTVLTRIPLRVLYQAHTFGTGSSSQI